MLPRVIVADVIKGRVESFVLGAVDVAHESENVNGERWIAALFAG